MIPNEETFARLLRDTICLMQRQQNRFFLDLPKTTTTLQETRFIEPQLPKKSEDLATQVLAVPEYEEKKPKMEINTPFPHSQKTWALRHMDLPDENPTLTERFANYFSNTPLDIPIRLVAPSSALPPQLLFLENVARAITQKWSPATVHSEIQLVKLLESSDCKLIIVPHLLLKKKFPQLQIHGFYKTIGPTLLPLEELDRYLNDPNLKRTLWTTLKTFPFKNMPPSL